MIAALAGAAALTLAAGPAGAAQEQKGDLPKREVAYQPKAAKKGDVGTQSASSGGRSGDWNGDGVKDLLLRRGGDLLVSLHTGTYNGTATYAPPVAINYGWGNVRWLGQIDIDGNGLADLLAVYPNGDAKVFLHSGTFNGLNTLAPWPDGEANRPVVAYNLDIYDLIMTGDITGDGKDDLVGRRGDRTFLHTNTGQIGDGAAFFGAQLFVWGEGLRTDREQNLADVTLDGKLDFVFVASTGDLVVFDLASGTQTRAAVNWHLRSALTLSDVNKDGKVDLLGRIGTAGRLEAFTHGGTWQGENTFALPVWLGDGYNQYSVIS
ncbi:FG-GAP-like repeat-containing protein [Amycolatopsis suaedae]|nr:FG-GAP-like repeat-containing protein [Amycolatopsis suaedae]